MELRYPYLFIILIFLFIILYIVVIKKNKNLTFKNGTKVANTEFIKNTDYYKTMIKRYKIVYYLLSTVSILCIFLSILMISRIYVTESPKRVEYNRDIYLCMDSSSSVDNLNLELVGYLKSTVNRLKSDRFGISIFNTSSITLLPLTNDYKYTEDILDKLYDSFDVVVNKKYSRSDFLDRYNYITSGTIENYEVLGSSLIGDGLASCLFKFDDKGNKRTKVVIFSTDNDVYGKESITLLDAAKLAKKRNITVYGISSEKTTFDNKNNFKQAVEITGGKFYDINNFKVNEIINDIEKLDKTKIVMTENIHKVDKPELVFILLLLSFSILTLLGKEVSK